MFLRIYTGATTWFDGLKARAADEGGQPRWGTR